jgi:hypothetical protein
VFFTEEDQELTVDFFHRGMMTLTDSSDRVMIFMPGAAPAASAISDARPRAVWLQGHRLRTDPRN